jgi:hypothetical protein
MSYDLRFKRPFSCFIAVPSGSGKSSFCIKLLQHLESQGTEPEFAGGILWCYGEKYAKPSPRYVSGKRIQYFEVVPGNFKNEGGRPALIILDDLLLEVYSKQVCTFTKGCHHRNISVLVITQNLYHQGTFCRDISLNTKYHELLKYTSTLVQQFTHLARQVYPENSNSLYESYLDATEKAHGYLVLDFAQDTDDKLR